MLFLLIPCSLSLIVLLYHTSLSLNPMRFLSPCFWKHLSLFPNCLKNALLNLTLSLVAPRMLIKKKRSPPMETPFEAPAPGMYVLDLPDLVLECILQKLPPEGLSRMASVCTSLRDMCSSDHLWEWHMRQKWGRIMSPNFYTEWAASRRGSAANVLFNQGKDKGFLDYLAHLWPPALIRSGFGIDSVRKRFPPPDSIMSWYLALESGRFWFPAQVFNRENGHVGFMLSCYDAELSYDRRTDTFRARYPPHGRRISSIETGLTWDRLRASPVHTSPHDLHVSNCLNELQPGDQIEIQWRRNKEFPYGWWYGIVGHLETCDGNPNYCQCHDSDALVLEFNQYTRGSRWRTTTVSRKDHSEEGNEADGFYGGIRKLCGNEEISKWEKLWPIHILE